MVSGRIRAAGRCSVREQAWLGFRRQVWHGRAGATRGAPCSSGSGSSSSSPPFRACFRSDRPPTSTCSTTPSRTAAGICSMSTASARSAPGPRRSSSARTTTTVDDPAFQATVQRVTDALRADPEIVAERDQLLRGDRPGSERRGRAGLGRPHDDDHPGDAGRAASTTRSSTGRRLPGAVPRRAGGGDRVRGADRRRRQPQRGDQHDRRGGPGARRRHRRRGRLPHPARRLRRPRRRLRAAHPGGHRRSRSPSGCPRSSARSASSPSSSPT